ncbi:MAG: ribonuclease III [Planctomycetota bacterium]|nr:MAG: ribonuclease III [Planctomycetota bacterium]
MASPDPARDRQPSPRTPGADDGAHVDERGTDNQPAASGRPPSTTSERSAPAGRPAAGATEASEDWLDRCEEILGYHFRDRELLRRCLTHASRTASRLASNERLEFLGDAILGAVVCETIFRRFPQAPEGTLTEMKSMVVSRAACARVAQSLGLEQVIFVGKGLSARPTIPSSVLAATLEAIIGGVYLDAGFETARRFVRRIMEPELLRAANARNVENFKSRLQEFAQKHLGRTPVYRVIEEQGPDHRKQFRVCAQIGDRRFPPAWGRSKKQAEQAAAEHALRELAAEHPDAHSLLRNGSAAVPTADGAGS